MRIKVNSLLQYCATLAIIFSDILRNGNLNLLYFLSVIYFVFILKDRKSYYKQLFFLLGVLIIIQIINAFGYSSNYLNVQKSIVYILKLTLCFTLMFTIKCFYKRIGMKKVIELATIVLSFCILLSVIKFGDPAFWRLNDYINVVSKTRLQFMYSEPSVLGFVLGFFIIFIVYSLIKCGITNFKTLVLCILCLGLILTFSMSGIVYTMISILILVEINLIRTGNKRIRSRVAFFNLFFISIVAIALFTQNPISARLFNIVTGKDGSFYFRYTSAIIALKDILDTTHWFGLGFGNMNTNHGLLILLESGMDYKFSNSFMYFIAESGIMGILFLVFLLIELIQSISKSPKEVFDLKAVLLIYTFVTQIAGGYFTDPTLWLIYGIICSLDIDLNDVIVFQKTQ